MNRRRFALGAGCFACAAATAAAATAQDGAATSDEHFVCTTVDPATAPNFSVADYAASAGSDPQAIGDAIREFRITDYGTFYFNNRWRRSDGLTPNTGVITLGVHFMEDDAARSAEVRRVAPLWLEGDLGRLVVFRFDVPLAQAQIRIRFDPNGGNNSFVGRENLRRRANLHTMNLQNISKRVILHEFGHALGLHHEHHHPQAGIVWKEEVVIAELYASQGWTPEYIRANVINRFSSAAACVGDPAFNQDSIMLYEIPARWTKNGFSSPRNTDISSRDRQCLVGVYRPS